VASIEAPAKVNLFLRVLHRREDGYRELETLFQMLALADEVRIDFDPAGVTGGVTLEVDGPDLGRAEDNLAVRAARAFLAASATSGSVHLRLVKHIPAGGGLGGGSSDAAAVLRLLSEITTGLATNGLRTGRVPGEAELHRLAVGLGSDVPFFLGASPLALGRGRGELLSSLPPLPSVAVVLALPPVHVSTAEAYSALASSRSNGWEAEARPDEIVAELDWARVATLAENDFEPIAAARHRLIARSLEGLRDAGALAALLSGSGGASFGIFPSPNEAAAAAAELEAEFGWPFVATATLTLPPQPEWG
jgi:4-diphosphocytidyl-2-C-methyl-D-erythritol kinase